MHLDLPTKTVQHKIDIQLAQKCNNQYEQIKTHTKVLQPNLTEKSFGLSNLKHITRTDKIFFNIYQNLRWVIIGKKMTTRNSKLQKRQRETTHLSFLRRRFKK